jgi:hypothetical protein
MNNNLTLRWHALPGILLAALTWLPPTAFAQGTAFTYQGRLNDGTNPATGVYDFCFAAYSAPTGLSPRGNGFFTNNAVPVTRGLFTVTLDLGPGVFDGSDHWLEIAVRTNGGGAFSTLTPRQSITPTPYAIYASKALAANSASSANSAISAISAGTASYATRAGSVTASGITGAIGSSQLAAGSITSAQLASGAVQSSNLAPGIIGATQLARRYDAGRITVGGDEFPVLANADGSAQLNVAFNASFNNLPIVTFSVEEASAVTGTGPQVTLTNKSATNFSMLVKGFEPSISVLYDKAGTVQVDAENDLGDYNSCAIVNGVPAISCFDRTRKALMFARAADAAGSRWLPPITVDAGVEIGVPTHLMVAGAFPVICYVDNSNYTLKFVRALDADGNSWGFPVTISTNCSPDHITLAMVGGYPAVGFTTPRKCQLAFARANDILGSSWGSVIIVDAGKDYFPSLAMVEGRPAMAYEHRDTGSFMYVRAADENGTAWQTPSLLKRGDNNSYNNLECSYGKYASLAVLNGKPIAACRIHDHLATALSGVMFVRGFDVDFLSCQAVVTYHAGYESSSGSAQDRIYHEKHDCGRNLSLAVINSQPVLLFSYTEIISGSDPIHWIYSQAASADGTIWDQLRQVALSSVATLPSLLNLNGLPAASIYVDGQLKFTRSTANGWNGQYVRIPKTGPELTGLIGGLVTADNLPLAVFHDPGKGDLKCLKALDASGAQWQSTPTTMDTGGNVGQDSSMAWLDDSMGIAYCDFNSGHIRFVRTLGARWSAPVAVDASSEHGIYPSLAWAGGAPAVAYQDATLGVLRFVRARSADGSAWGNWQTLDSAGRVGMHPSLAIVNECPAIAYLGTNTLRYMQANEPWGDKWADPIALASFTPAKNCTVPLVVVNGNPAIAFADANAGLQYLRANTTNGASWGTKVAVDATPGSGEYASMAIIAGVPAIAYYDDNAGVLMYVRARDTNGISWGTPVIVDSTGAGPYACLREVAGKPAIAYYSAGLTKHLKYAEANDILGASWNTPVTVDADGECGEGACLASGGSLTQISYYHRSTTALKVATKGWTSQVVDGGASVGKFLSLALIGNRPAASYYDESNQRLKFVMAANPYATTWNAPVAVDSTPRAGMYSSLADVGGYPAIAYYDYLNAKLKFTRALNATGSNWSPPATIDSDGDVGRFASLAVVNSNPAIAYYDATRGDLKFVRATATDGSTWGSPQTVEPGDVGQDVGQYASLAVVNGRAAIAYYDRRFRQLKFIRANDDDGTSWNHYQLLDQVGDVGHYICLRVIGGKPSISYYSVTDGDLKLVRAKDSAGSTWETPITLNTVNDVGRFSVLTSVNNNPSVLYFDYTAGKIKNYYPVKPFQLNWFAVEP